MNLELKNFELDKVPRSFSKITIKVYSMSIFRVYWKMQWKKANPLVIHIVVLLIVGGFMVGHTTFKRCNSGGPIKQWPTSFWRCTARTCGIMSWASCVGIWSNIMLMIVNCCLQCMVKGDGNEQPQATGSNPIPRKIHNGLRSNGWIRRHY